MKLNDASWVLLSAVLDHVTACAAARLLSKAVFTRSLMFDAGLLIQADHTRIRRTSDFVVESHFFWCFLVFLIVCTVK
jgi:hypothetical protein